VRKEAGSSFQDGEDRNAIDGEPPDSVRMGIGKQVSGSR